MRIILLILFFPLFSAAQAQNLDITPGTYMAVSGAAQLVLSDISYNCNGHYSPGKSTVTFTGNGSDNVFINGNDSIFFSGIRVNRPNAGVQLLHDAFIQDTITMVSGYLVSGGYGIDLGYTGYVSGEHYSSEIFMVGSSIRSLANVPALQNSNPGNLGLAIESVPSPGPTVVYRTNNSVTLPNGLTSIYRVYHVVPTYYSGLNATLRFYYSPIEMTDTSAAARAILTLYSYYPTSATWINLGVDSVGSNPWYVQKSGVNLLDSFTLFEMVPLPQLAKAVVTATAFPNPATGLFTVGITAPVAKQYTMVVVSEKGVVIKQQLLNAQRGLNNVQLDLSHQPSGMYYLLPDGPGSPPLPLYKL